MKKKVFIAIGIIVVLIIAVIGYMVVTDMKQEKKLVAEFKYVDGLVEKEESETDEIKKALERTVTRGDYKKLEKAYKQYLTDIYQNMDTMVNLMEDERIEESVTAKNYEEDGPEFTKTKKYLSETKQALEDGKNKFYDLLTEDGAMKYIKEQDVDSYYEEIYKQEIQGYINSEENQDETVRDSINDVINVLTTSEKIINFLSENKGAWSIEGESIVFDTESLSDEYDKLASEL